MATRLALVLIVCLCVPLVADDAKPSPQPAPLTELETLRIQNVNLERVIVQRALEDWQKKLAALKADLEKTRPGWVWNPEDGQWTRAAAPTTNDKHEPTKEPAAPKGGGIEQR